MENSKHIQRILDNLDITFIQCKIVYTLLEVERQKSNRKRRSTLKIILKAAEDKLDEFSGVSNERYIRCTFYPGDEAEIKRQVSSYETDSMKFKFVDCKFVRRESTLFENLVRKLRRIFGITFELNFITGAAEIEDRKLKVKDIPEIVALVVERIQTD